MKQVIETNILALPEMDKSQLNLERITLKKSVNFEGYVERQQIYCATLTICITMGPGPPEKFANYCVSQTLSRNTYFNDLKTRKKFSNHTAFRCVCFCFRADAERQNAAAE